MSRFVGMAICCAVLLAGCSQEQSIRPEELKSDARELVSIAEEGVLFANFVAGGQATGAYTQGHPEYLRRQAKAVGRELTKKSAEPDLQERLRLLRELSLQFEHALSTLPTDTKDPRWPEVARDLDKLASSARKVGNTF